MSKERFFGTVVWFEAKRGYGFVAGDTLDKQYFVHFSQIKMDGFRKLDEGQRVEFSIGEGPDGKPQAENVVRLDDEGSVQDGNSERRVQAK